YHLTATAPDATTGFRDRITLAPGEERTGVDIRLGREDVTVSGRLLDSGGGRHRADLRHRQRRAGPLPVEAGPGLVPAVGAGQRLCPHHRVAVGAGERDP